MTDNAIRAENLGKMFRIGARREGYGYKSFRETLAGLWRRSGRERRARSEPFWALKDVSFEVKPGEVVGVIGRNGAGKSTLLKVLSRITEPTEGFAEIRGRVGSLLEVGTGFHPELTGRENIFLNGAILGMRRAEIAAEFDKIVGFAEIEKFIDTPVKHYSSGMYMRLAFAVAAHLNSEILLVDEVLAVGDAQFQRKCLGKMNEVASAGRTVLFVSHNLAAVQNLCGRVLLLSQGRCEASGEPMAVLNRYLEGMRDMNGAALAERKDRRGDGRLRFTSCGFAAQDGLNSTVVCGSEARLRLGYTLSGPAESIAVSIGVLSLVGQKVLCLGNDVTGEVLSGLPVKGYLDCCFEKFPLLAGSYRLDLFCTCNGQICDWVKDAAVIEVVEGDFYGSGRLPPSGYGHLVVLHHWQCQPEAAT